MDCRWSISMENQAFQNKYLALFIKQARIKIADGVLNSAKGVEGRGRRRIVALGVGEALRLARCIPQADILCQCEAENNCPEYVSSYGVTQKKELPKGSFSSWITTVYWFGFFKYLPSQLGRHHSIRRKGWVNHVAWEGIVSPDQLVISPGARVFASRFSDTCQIYRWIIRCQRQNQGL